MANPNTSGLANEETLYRVAELFKVFGDPTRIRILHALSDRELCVQEIADQLEMTQSAISHQLRILKQSFLVNSAVTVRPSITLWQMTTFSRS